MLARLTKNLPLLNAVKVVRSSKRRSDFKYKGKTYCNSCLAEELGIEAREVNYNQYYDVHGDFLGDDNDGTLEDILLNCSFVESLGD